MELDGDADVSEPLAQGPFQKLDRFPPAPRGVALRLEDERSRRREGAADGAYRFRREVPARDEFHFPRLLPEPGPEPIARRLRRYGVPIDARPGVERAVRLDLDGQPILPQFSDERFDVLRQRFAAGEANPAGRIAAPEPADIFRDLADGLNPAPPPSALRITEGTSQVAAGETDEDRRLALAQALALNRGENLNRLQYRWPTHPRIPRRSRTGPRNAS